MVGRGKGKPGKWILLFPRLGQGEAACWGGWVGGELECATCLALWGPGGGVQGAGEGAHPPAAAGQRAEQSPCRPPSGPSLGLGLGS